MCNQIIHLYSAEDSHLHRWEMNSVLFSCSAGVQTPAEERMGKATRKDVVQSFPPVGLKLDSKSGRTYAEA